jgi:hypothetical protein
MTSTLTDKAVVGRRIIHDHASRKAKLPGIITRLNDGFGGGFFIRLDGDRSSILVPTKFVWRITFLDEVVDVPELPTGRFQPTSNDLEGDWEGVPLCTVSEDGALVLLTTDRNKARTAATAYFTEIGVDLDYVNFDYLKLRWAVFEWQPEDAETDWHVRWDASEGDDQAIHLYYLPA